MSDPAIRSNGVLPGRQSPSPPPTRAKGPVGPVKNAPAHIVPPPPLVPSRGQGPVSQAKSASARIVPPPPLAPIRGQGPVGQAKSTPARIVPPPPLAPIRGQGPVGQAKSAPARIVPPPPLAPIRGQGLVGQAKSAPARIGPPKPAAGLVQLSSLARISAPAGASPAGSHLILALNGRRVGMETSHGGVNQRGYPQLQVPIGRMPAATRRANTIQRMLSKDEDESDQPFELDAPIRGQILDNSPLNLNCGKYCARAAIQSSIPGIPDEILEKLLGESKISILSIGLAWSPGEEGREFFEHITTPESLGDWKNALLEHGPLIVSGKIAHVAFGIYVGHFALVVGTKPATQGKNDILIVNDSFTTNKKGNRIEWDLNEFSKRLSSVVFFVNMEAVRNKISELTSERK